MPTAPIAIGTAVAAAIPEDVADAVAPVAEGVVPVADAVVKPLVALPRAAEAEASALESCEANEDTSALRELAAAPVAVAA